MSKDAELPKRLLAGPELAEDAVYDFLYVDRGRVSSLYAQLFPEGTLTSVKTTAQKGFAEEGNVGSDIKVLKAEKKSTDSGFEGIEHVFDPSWIVPVETLTELHRRAFLQSSLKSPRLGMLVLLPGYLRIIDYATMRNLWEPGMTLFAGEEAPQLKPLVELMKNIPHTMHAHFLTKEGFVWSSLEQNYLTVPASDIVLKHGGCVSGLWNVLFGLDAFPDAPSPELDSWSAGGATDGVLTAIRGLRAQIGRPPGWFGGTPLMIFREIPPFANQESLDLKPGTS